MSRAQETLLAVLFLGAACTPDGATSPRPTPGTGGDGGSSVGTGGAGAGGVGTGGTGGAGGGAGGSTGGSGGRGGSTGGSGGSGGTSGADAGSARDSAGSSADGPVSAPNPGPTNLAAHKFVKTLTLDTTAAGAGVMADVPGYPVAVQLNAMNFDFTQAKGNGEDLRFSSMDGTVLPYEIEWWDAAAKTAAIWVKVDVKGNNGTQSIQMHWGNPEAASASNGSSVFRMEDGFVGVYHLSESPGNDPDAYKDSSANAAHLTGFNMDPMAVAIGRIGRAPNLQNPGGQGKNQWLGVTGPKVADTFNATAAHPITATAWATARTFSGYYETIISKGDTSWTLQRDYMGRMEACTWSGRYHSCTIAGAPPRNQWRHYMVVQTQTQLFLYIDGKQAVAPQGSFGRTGVHGFAISHNYQADSNANSGRREWDGIIDEARVMHGVKNANWALLDFQSQKEGSTFLKFGPTQMK